MKKLLPFVLVITTASLLSGCTFIFQKGRRVDVEKISKLQTQLSDMDRAKKELEDKLNKEIGDKDVKVEMLDKGLTITFVAEVLFDSGKADLKETAKDKLLKVADVLNSTAKDYRIGIEGHTDNEPIKHSGWKSNWELSAHRALGVLHYLIDNGSLEPTRVSAIAYGEFHPVMSNDDKAGRQKNRRVEIVILPKDVKKVKANGE
ncbi:MAG: flagellar motor protein MotB [Candidatus Omnitrophica bacterium]|nr:flagellar motor protein MotB [Candidatus Omnitrophota bacterium]